MQILLDAHIMKDKKYSNKTINLLIRIINLHASHGTTERCIHIAVENSSPQLFYFINYLLFELNIACVHEYIIAHIHKSQPFLFEVCTAF